MKLLQGVPSLIFGVLFDLVVVYLPLLLLPQEKSPVKINLCEDAAKLKKALCARIEKILKTSWTIKTVSEPQQE